MKKYKASISIENELKVIDFETKENPIEHLWGKYGMDSFIEWLEEVEED